jgi:uncharacterized protein (UPF0371 family)
MASRETEIEQIIQQIDDRLEDLRAIEKALRDLHASRVLNGVDPGIGDREEER